VGHYTEETFVWKVIGVYILANGVCVVVPAPVPALLLPDPEPLPLLDAVPVPLPDPEPLLLPDSEPVPLPSLLPSPQLARTLVSSAGLGLRPRSRDRQCF